MKQRQHSVVVITSMVAEVVLWSTRYTEEEAQKACAEERAKVAKEMAWWVKKYITDEHYTVAKVVVTA